MRPRMRATVVCPPAHITAIVCFTILFICTAAARISATLDQCIDRYGSALTTSGTQESSSARFKKSDFTIEVKLENEQVTEISYRKEAAPFRVARLPQMTLAEWTTLFGQSVPLLTSDTGAVLHRFRSGAVLIEASFKDNRPTGSIRYLTPPSPRSKPMQVPKYLIGENLQTWETDFGPGRLAQETNSVRLYEWSHDGLTVQAWFRNGKQHGWPLSFDQSELSASMVDSLLDRSVFTAAEREILIKNNIRANVIEHVQEEDGKTLSYAVSGSQRVMIASFDPKTNRLVIRSPETVSTETIAEEINIDIKDL